MRLCLAPLTRKSSSPDAPPGPGPLLPLLLVLLLLLLLLLLPLRTQTKKEKGEVKMETGAATGARPPLQGRNAAPHQLMLLPSPPDVARIYAARRIRANP